MEKLAVLREEAKVSDGWVQLVDKPKVAAWTVQSEAGDTLIRMTVKFDLPARLTFESMYYCEEECLKWRFSFKSIKIVKQFSEEDRIIQFQPNIGFAFKYIMSVPDWVSCRVLGRRDWPEEGQYAFAIIPWDIEKEIPVEQIGPIKINSGVVIPDPEDPNKSICTRIDRGNFKYMPSFALRMIIENKLIPTLEELVVNFKKSDYHAQLTAQ